LRPDLSLKGHPSVYLAGQITGVEGYLESAACGLLSAIFIDQRIQKKPHLAPPANTALGALLRHITGSDPKNYQPANINFSLFDPGLFEHMGGLKRDESRKNMAIQAQINFSNWMNSAI
jgi:methylenetetrahydrofolate--tRNA-(uracil-5-)-methyltransferase